MRYLILDGMLSGTGIRDAVEGGYLGHSQLEISGELSARIHRWLAAYAESHYRQHADAEIVANLDSEGIELCKLLRQELPADKIGYFSDATMQTLEEPVRVGQK